MNEIIRLKWRLSDGKGEMTNDFPSMEKMYSFVRTLKKWGGKDSYITTLKVEVITKEIDLLSEIFEKGLDKLSEM